MNAVEEYHEFTHNGKDQKHKRRNRRFMVLHKYGMNVAMSDSNSDPKAEEISMDLTTIKQSCRLLGYDMDDIAANAPSEKPYMTYLAFPDEILANVRDMERWIKSKDWYRIRGIPWTRGWLLHGLPGTGKTALVRGVAELLDMPIIIMDMSTFSNQDFSKTWRNSVANYSPCIMLLEDIDGVFNGRENVRKSLDGNVLTFDCLLNTLDGVDKSGGVFTIITTNKPETLDSALCLGDDVKSSRPGRIDRAIKLDVMDECCRRKIAGIILNECPEEQERIVREGEGCTAAQFQEMCSGLALRQYWERKDVDLNKG